MSIPFEPTALEDALSLLEAEDSTWVVIRSRVFLPYNGDSTWAHGVWNYIFDVYVFWVEAEGPDCLIVSEGSIEESDWSIYRAEDKLNIWFVKRFRECCQMRDDIVRMDRKL